VQDGFTGPLSGGNACSTIANAEVLNQGSADAPNPVIHATGVFAQSVTQQCDPTQGLPFGSADLVDLTIGGQSVFGTTNKKPTDTGQIPPNTVISLPNLATIILNEQKLDNKAAGQGLTVNAVHVFTLSPLTGLVAADVIIGHTHSSAYCTTAPSKQPCEVVPSTDKRCNPGVIITKTDNTGVAETAQQGQVITYTLSIDTKNLAAGLLIRKRLGRPGRAVVGVRADRDLVQGHGLCEGRAGRDHRGEDFAQRGRWAMVQPGRHLLQLR
jgi:hypothetical protein